MKITAVIVLYNKKYKECQTLVSLERYSNYLQQENIQLEVLLYDNSEYNQMVPPVYNQLPVTYIHDPRNLGVATPYNRALDIATKNGSEWLLVLDHDTEISKDYIMEISCLLHDKKLANKKTVAIAPRVFYNETQISPVSVASFRPLNLPTIVPGNYTNGISGINSGLVLSVSYLNELNGFSEEFPLDYLDHWLFYEIQNEGHEIIVLHAQLQHDLSVMNYETISIARYQSILDSEILFYQNYDTNKYKKLKTHLWLRFFKQLIQVKNKKIAFYTLKKIFAS